MIHTLSGPLFRATILKRPSATIKSPYVADIRLDDGRLALCHTPGLGCSGLVEANRYIYVNASKPGSKTAFTTQLAECTDAEGVFYVGIHPMVSQTAARNLLSRISAEATWSSEVVIEKGTRIDYVGMCPNGKKIYVEVKTGMTSLEHSIPRIHRHAIFPDGYRKKLTDAVSPRAVKHAETLAQLAKDPNTEAAILLFIVPRTDCGEGLTINPADPIYCEAVRKAVVAGVQLKAFSLHYMPDGTICADKEVTVVV
jgi:DNA-binding sugar fermentation-stimulating protein